MLLALSVPNCERVGSVKYKRIRCVSLQEVCRISETSYARSATHSVAITSPTIESYQLTLFHYVEVPEIPDHQVAGRGCLDCFHFGDDSFSVVKVTEIFQTKIFYCFGSIRWNSRCDFFFADLNFRLLAWANYLPGDISWYFLILSSRTTARNRG